MTLIPTVIEKTNGNERAYDIYSRLLKDRIIIISSQIDDNISSVVVAQLLFLDAQSHEDISLYINSPGGSITSGMAIYDTMNFIKSDVQTICIGMAASMGAFLLAGGHIGKRCILPNAEVMIHQPLGGIEGQASDIKIAADRIIQTRQKLNEILAERTSNNLDDLVRDTDRNYFMSAEEALDYGIVDKIIK